MLFDCEATRDQHQAHGPSTSLDNIGPSLLVSNIRAWTDLAWDQRLPLRPRGAIVSSTLFVSEAGLGMAPRNLSNGMALYTYYDEGQYI